MEKHERLKWARERAGIESAAEAARRYGWKKETYTQHENGTRGFPNAKAESYARAYRVRLEWLAHGRGDPAGTAPASAESPATEEDFISIPRRDVRLSGGHGFENLDDAPVLDRIPFTREFLRDRLNRTNIKGLVMVKATGDSMEPTIGHDDLVMVDAQDWEIRPGIFAVVLQGEAMVKRLEQVGDRVAVISDNKHYPPLYVGTDQRHAFHVIGRVRWIGRVLL